MSTTVKSSKLLRIGLCLLGMYICGAPGFSQTPMGLPFLQLEVGGRAQAMGGAYTAVAQSANGMHYNPAGLGFGHSRELMFFHARWFSDISLENVTFLYPFSRRFSLGSSISYLHMPAFRKYDVDPATGGPVEAGAFTAYDMLFATAVGFRIHDNLALGGNIKLIEERLESVSARGLAFDLGMLAVFPASGIRLGFAVQHLGAAVRYLEARSPLPLTYRAGLAYRIAPLNSTIAIDVTRPGDRPIQVQPGIEMAVGDNLFLRGGYRSNSGEGSGLAAGFGFSMFNEHKINYVYAPYGQLGDTHRAELILHLGTAGGGYSPPDHLDTAAPAANKAREIIAAIEPETPYPSGDLSKLPLPAPNGLKIEHLEENKIKLSWEPIPLPGLGYFIYAQPAGSTRWVKITERPLNRAFQLFSQKRAGVRISFAVSAVLNNRESEMSAPIEFDGE